MIDSNLPLSTFKTTFSTYTDAKTDSDGRKFRVETQEISLSSVQRIWQLFQAVFLTAVTCGIILLSHWGQKKWYEAYSGKKIIQISIPIELEQKTPGTALKTPKKSALKKIVIETPKNSEAKQTESETPKISPLKEAGGEIPSETPKRSAIKPSFSETPKYSGFKSRVLETPKHSGIKPTAVETPKHSAIKQAVNETLQNMTPAQRVLETPKKTDGKKESLAILPITPMQTPQKIVGAVIDKFVQFFSGKKAKIKEDESQLKATTETDLDEVPANRKHEVLELIAADFPMTEEQLEARIKPTELKKVTLQCPKGGNEIFENFIEVINYFNFLREGEERLEFTVEIVDPTHIPFMCLDIEQSFIYFKMLENQDKNLLKKIIEVACQENTDDNIVQIFCELTISDLLFYFPLNSSESFKMVMLKELTTEQYCNFLVESDISHADLLIDILQLPSLCLIFDSEYKTKKMDLINKILSLELKESHLSKLFTDNSIRGFSLEQFKCLIQKLGILESIRRVPYFLEAFSQISNMNILERLKRVECVSGEDLIEILTQLDDTMSNYRLDICYVLFQQFMNSQDEIPLCKGIFKQLKEVNEYYEFGKGFSSICLIKHIPGTIQCLAIGGGKYSQHLVHSFIQGILNRKLGKNVILHVFNVLWMLIHVDKSFQTFENIKDVAPFIITKEHVPVLFESLLKTKLKPFSIKKDIIDNLLLGYPKLFENRATVDEMKGIIQELSDLGPARKRKWINRLENSRYSTVG